ncbi:hypothetical protein [Enterobacter hormaechei]|uniref:hypothetical protein n=1 Tax=Enterobacter hormaechei TaxID=158836 RepID=UPI002072B2EE|nr:hypothetical protein [Enterobacter hormaechei]
MHWFFGGITLEQHPDRTVSFNVNVPLGHWLPDSSVSYFINHNNRGMTTQQVSLNGSAGEPQP